MRSNAEMIPVSKKAPWDGSFGMYGIPDGMDWVGNGMEGEEGEKKSNCDMIAARYLADQ